MQTTNAIKQLFSLFLVLICANIYAIQKDTGNTTSIFGNSDFSVTIIGSGSPQYNPARSQPSALIQYKGITFLVDMGNGTMTHLETLGLTGRNAPDALFLTHHHIDHNAEFIPMVHSKLLTGKEFLIAGPAPIDEMTRYTKQFYKEDMNYRLRSRGKTFDENSSNETIKTLKGGENFDYMGVKISTLEVPHSIKTIAYRFEADGKSIVISGDLSYTSDLAKFASNADVLVIDGKTASNRSNTNRSNGNAGQTARNRNTSNTQTVSAHASLEEVAKMATECNAKNLVITHLGTQPANQEATSNRYAELGFRGKVIIAADLLTINTEGDYFSSKP